MKCLVHCLSSRNQAVHHLSQICFCLFALLEFGLLLCLALFHLPALLQNKLQAFQYILYFQFPLSLFHLNFLGIRKFFPGLFLIKFLEFHLSQIVLAVFLVFVGFRVVIGCGLSFFIFLKNSLALILNVVN